LFLELAEYKADVRSFVMPKNQEIDETGILCVFGCADICLGTRTSGFLHAAPKLVARMSGLCAKDLFLFLRPVVWLDI
jgi:hypothetical protein